MGRFQTSSTSKLGCFFADPRHKVKHLFKINSAPMHNNYYFLRHLSNSLGEILPGFVLEACLSQQKSELLLHFSKAERIFQIRAVLHSPFNMLTFPPDFARSRRNSINLFKDALGQSVESVYQFENERCFSLVLSGRFVLLFKLFGNQSNIILFKEGRACDLFLKKRSADLKIDLKLLDRKIEQNAETLQKNGLKQVFPTFGRTILSELDGRGYQAAACAERRTLVNTLLNELQTPSFYLCEAENSLPALLLYRPSGSAYRAFSATNPLEVSNDFFKLLAKAVFLRTEKRPMLNKIEKEIRRAQNYITKNEQKYAALAESSRYEEFGHLLMANLSEVPPHAKSVALADFYNDNQTVRIALKPKLSAQKNAEVYYRKAKNQKIELKKIRENIAGKKAEIAVLEAQKAEIEPLDNVRALRKFLKNNKADKQAETQILPFRKFSFGGYDILVGKNAKSNDILTKNYSFKEDIWLHARGASGSHVLVKHRSGQKTPAVVIEVAARLAAYYSQRKNDSLCAVIYTPKKYVRKPKGAAAGAVVIGREDVIMVEPAAPSVLFGGK